MKDARTLANVIVSSIINTLCDFVTSIIIHQSHLILFLITSLGIFLGNTNFPDEIYISLAVSDSN